MTVLVQAEVFNPGEEINSFTAANPEAGAIGTFIGQVRGAGGVTALTLEHYPGMTEKSLTDLETQARSRWPLDDILIIHRFGRLEPADPIVLVATASAHRDAALEACQFLMDQLKTTAPFWKKEETGSGESWVDAKDSDVKKAEDWKG